jgi:uncharacterized protein (TIGR00661 family)
MRLIYGVVGEGMGHATRSRVLLEHLLARGHEIHVVVSGRAHAFLKDKLKDRAGITVQEIEGLNLRFEGNDLDLSESVLSNVDKLPSALRKNVDAYRALVGDLPAECVISDFESFAYFYARLNGLPVISVDNMQVINRCDHDAFVTDDKSLAFRIAKLAVKAKLPGAYHYVVSSFFFPRVKKPRTTLVPPILRPEVLAAKREPGAHVLVYQTSNANQALVDTLKTLPHQFRVYGMGRAGQEGNVTLCAFSEKGFIDDLRTARAVVAGGGYSLMGEAVHLHVPMLSIPIGGQYEQELNARYLDKLGYGAFGDTPSAETIASFLARTDAMQSALERYTPRDNAMLFSCVDELLEHVRLGHEPPARLDTAALGAWQPEADA